MQKKLSLDLNRPCLGRQTEPLIATHHSNLNYLLHSLL
jgi:hypothetical protein